MVMSAFPSSRRRLTAALALVATAVVVTAPAASAATVSPCTIRQESTPFARWGDSHSYFLMPNGGFESGSAPWAVSGGAAVANGNESYFVNGAADSHSLVLPAGASAKSQTICVGRGESSVRLFVKNPGVSAAQLNVQIIVEDPQTGRVAQTRSTVSSSSLSAGWSPTLRMLMPNLLGGSSGTQNLTLVISTAGQPATWSIDDVFVDPIKLR
jgi:hypothetical protein